MRLYNKADFLKLPANTLYSRVDKNRGSLIDGLFCKMNAPGTWGEDWIEQPLIGEAIIAECPEGITNGGDICDYSLCLRDNFQDFKLDFNFAGRDGMFDDGDQFVVWDADDISKLINFLGNCLPSNYQHENLRQISH